MGVSGPEWTVKSESKSEEEGGHAGPSKLCLETLSGCGPHLTGWGRSPGESVLGAVHGLCGVLTSTPSISPASTAPLCPHGFQMEGKESLKLEHETQ